MNTPIARRPPASPQTRRAVDPAADGLQREFARLSRQVTLARRRLQAWREAPEALIERVRSALAPAMAKQRDAEHHLAIQLDALLVSPPKGLRLGAQRRAALVAHLLDLCRGLLAHGRDDTLLAIHDRHSGYSHTALQAQTRADAMTQALAMLDAAFGAGAVRPQPGESDEAFFLRAEERLFEAYEAERAREDGARARRAQRRDARKAARDAAKADAARRRRAPGAAHNGSRSTAPQTAGADGPAAPDGPPPGASGSGDVATPPADGADVTPDERLRALYRRLASALHPDRAPDGEARTRRTVQMKALNAAWEARDLLAMLALQADARPDEPPPALADAQARDYVVLLQAQLDSLKAEARRAADAATPPDIAIARGRPREPAQLMQWLEMDVQHARRNAAILREVAAALADPALRRQAVDALLERAEVESMRRALDAFIDDLGRQG